jgi:hypothetical protein
MDGVTGSRAVDFLEHYGVKGMRWGVRRSDAELKRARKERKAAAKAEKAEAKEEKKGQVSSNRAATKDRKRASNELRFMSDADLDRYMNRLQNEKKTRDLLESDLSPGKKAVKAVTSESGKRILGNVIAGAGMYATVRVIEKKFGSEMADNIKRGGKPKK